MKKLIFVMAGLFIIGMASAQDRNDLKGPAAKNYKPWKMKSITPTHLVTKADKEKLMGPTAKNRKAWKNENELFVVTNSSPRKTMGPAAKNYKPWEDDREATRSVISRRKKQTRDKEL